MSTLSVRDPGEDPKVPLFPMAILGYQRRAVDRYVKGLLESRSGRSQVAELQPGSSLSVEHLNRYQDLGREIGDLLTAVQETAVKIREQAEADAAHWRGEATIEVQKRIAEAQAASEELREAAWDVSTQMIVQIQQMEAEAHRSIEKHSQEVIAGVENESHRVREDARHRAEAIRSKAHVESLEVEERTRELCDQMIESAEQQVSAIQERVLALERHRDQLLEEIGGIRSGVAPIGVKLVDQTGGLIYPPSPSEEAPAHATPQHEMSGLVKVISPTEESREEPADQPPADSGRETGTPTPGEDILKEAPEGREVGSSRRFDDIFAALRGAADAPTGPVVERREKPRRPVAPPTTEDTSQLQEAMLLPIANQFVRLFKRLLTEEQNRVLEGIRTERLAWGEEEVEGRLRSHLEMLMEQSWQAGHSAAERLAGHSIPRPGLAMEAEKGFVSRLVADVNDAMGSEGSGEDASHKSLMVSRMFRVWRSEKLERHLQQMSESYFQQGLVESLETAGIGKG